MAQVHIPEARDGLVCFEFTTAEFEGLLNYLAESGIQSDQIETLRQCGFLAPLKRQPGSEWLFQVCKVDGNVNMIAVYRELCSSAFRKFIESTAQ